MKDADGTGAVMDWVQAASIGTGAAAILAAVLAYFKYKPGQRERIRNETGLAEVDIAQGTLNFTKEAAQFVAGHLREEIAQLRADMQQIRDAAATQAANQERRLVAVVRELAEVRVQLAATKKRLDLVTNERDELRRENEHLRGRVQSLEHEVRALKAT